jgi:carbamoyl-phosphate synthase large subunit
MNILLTCAGRRSYLVAYFKQALAGRGRVLACDCCAGAAALAEADGAFVVPPVDHPGYFRALLALCREHAVGLLLPLNDLELARLAEQAPRFREAGTFPVVATPAVTATCLDKWATFEFLTAAGLPTPETFLSPADARRALERGAIRFPLLIKPRWGSGSIGVEGVEDERELDLAYAWARLRLGRTVLARMSAASDAGLVIQECVRGQEYGLDVVNDLEGRYAATFVRRKLAMRAGETDRAETVHDERLERLGRALGERLGHVGTLDCDVMVTERGGHVLDLNPRFGGGYPFSHEAGADLPATLIAWAVGEEPDPAWLRPRPGVVAAKCDHLVFGRPAGCDVPAVARQAERSDGG